MSISKLDKLKHRARSLINSGQWHAARTELEKISRKFPKDFDTWYLLGAVYGQINDINKAASASKKALSLQPGNLGALHNYGMALAKLGNNNESASVFKKSLKIHPQNAATHYSLGNVLKDLMQYDEAIAHLNESLRLAPGKAEALFSLGCIYTETEQFDKALTCLRKSSELDQGIKNRADYFIAFIMDRNKSHEAGLEHVKALHDSHAAIFNEHLTKGLEYKIPELLLYEYIEATDNPDKKIDILDLGCGTGLCGIQFINYANSMTGIDLSPQMVAKAESTNCYNKLVTTDIQSYLNGNQIKFDLILSADVFIYIGYLDDIFPRCFDALHNGGMIAFSTENIESRDYKLRISGRYAHSINYISKLAEASGFRILKHRDVVIRKEFGKDIAGKIFILLKQ